MVIHNFFIVSQSYNVLHLRQPVTHWATILCAQNRIQIKGMDKWVQHLIDREENNDS